jgi:fibronectin-binding autotransporter adhesin
LYLSGVRYHRYGKPTGVDAIIAGTSANPLLVSISSGSVAAQRLNTSFTVLTITAGSLTLTQDSTLDALVMSGGTLEFKNSASATSTFNGTVALTGGTLQVEAGILALIGSSTLNGVVSGTGTLVTKGGSSVDQLSIASGTTLDNQGTETVTTHGLFLGNGTAGTATLLNESGSTFDIRDNVGINSNGGSVAFINRGLLEKTVGTGKGFVNVGITDSGSILVSNGVLDFTGGGTFSGEIGGAGTLEFGGTAQTLEAGVTLSVGTVLLDPGRTLSFATDLTYDGALDGITSTLSLNTHTLTLSAEATAALYGALIIDGTLVARGIKAVDSLFIDNGATLDNQGIESLSTGNLFLGIGNNGTATLLNENGSTFDIHDNVGINLNGGSASITNRGLLEKTTGAGRGFINVGITDSGTILVSGGVLDFAGVAPSPVKLAALEQWSSVAPRRRLKQA